MAATLDSPPAENVDGVLKESHQFTHEVHHEINWGYVSVGVALLVLVWAVFLRSDRSGDRDGREEIAGGAR